MKIKFLFTALLYSAVISFVANCFVFVRQIPQALFLIVPVFLLTNMFAGIFTLKTALGQSRRQLVLRERYCKS